MTTKEFTVPEDTTLLPFLRTAMPAKGRNMVKHLLGRGQIWVDGQTQRQFNAPLRKGQVVTVAAAAKVPPPFPIVFEDEHLLVCNKPPGLLTVATDREQEHTAFRQLMAWYKTSRSSERVFVTHRLDRDTSGLMLFAKNPTLRDKMQADWDGYMIHRGYLAMVEGVPEPSEGILHHSLGETKEHKVYALSPGKEGQAAITRYETWKKGGQYSVLRLALETGRKNQIRVQLAALGCPVAGDRKYGGSDSGRLWLHAYKLHCKHPVSGEILEFETPPPRGMLAVYKKALVDR